MILILIFGFYFACGLERTKFFIDPPIKPTVGLFANFRKQKHDVMKNFGSPPPPPCFNCKTKKFPAMLIPPPNLMFIRFNSGFDLLLQ